MSNYRDPEHAAMARVAQLEEENRLLREEAIPLVVEKKRLAAPLPPAQPVAAIRPKRSILFRIAMAILFFSIALAGLVLVWFFALVSTAPEVHLEATHPPPQHRLAL